MIRNWYQFQFSSYRNEGPAYSFILFVSPVTVEELRRAGWDIVRVSERLDPRASDEEILSFARADSRVVISHDLDFSSLLALAGHDSPSVITLRLTSADPLFTAVRLKEAVQASAPILAKGCVVTIDDQYRAVSSIKKVSPLDAGKG